MSDFVVPLFGVNMSPGAPEAVAAMLLSGQVAEGPRVVDFERKIAYHFGLTHRHLDVVTVNSGTTAIELSLLLAGVGPGDEVITTPMTCTATTTAIVNRGARPVWADVEPTTGNIDIGDVMRRVTMNTKAVVVVEWAGRRCDIAALMRCLTAIDRREGPARVSVVEDAAHAFLMPKHDAADYRCFSFQAIKHLTTGDGGAVIMHRDHAPRARRLRWFGLDRTLPREQRFDAPQAEVGFKWHMNDIAATIGLANLDVAMRAVAQCRVNAMFYQSTVGHHVGSMDPTDPVRLPPPDATAAWWLYTVRANDRHAFQTYLHRRGVETSEVHRRNDRIDAFAQAAGPTQPGDLPELDVFASQQVSIPVGWWLTPAQRNLVANAVIDYVNANRSRRPSIELPPSM